MNRNLNSRFYVLGEADAEMSAIEALLSLHGRPYIYATRTRGKGGCYLPYPVGPDPESIGVSFDGQTGLPTREGETVNVVFLECVPPPSWPEGNTAFLPLAGDLPTVLEVLDDLREMFAAPLSPEYLRWLEVLAAHDHLGMEGVAAVGATQAEVDRLFSLDNTAREVTPGQLRIAHEIAVSAVEDSADENIRRHETESLRVFLVEDLRCASALSGLIPCGTEILLIAPNENRVVRVSNVFDPDGGFLDLLNEDALVPCDASSAIDVYELGEEAFQALLQATAERFDRELSLEGQDWARIG